MSARPANRKGEDRMARFFNDHACATLERKNVSREFSDLLFHELQKSVFKDKAPAALALHLGIEVSEVESWLRGDAFPNRELISRLIVMFRGNNYFAVESADSDEVKDCTWTRIVEFVGEVENIHQLQSVKLTVPKAAVVWHSTSQAKGQEAKQDG